ncbi:MAG: thiolase family protein [Candidatus Nanopelagicales bacterium]|jgi:acetyl-CoA acetyltransferase|nr:thiolase family protein [Candidatus Nanopelagicales bacterium]
MSEDVYIVGASRTVFGRFEGEDHDLAEEAVRGALADAGITWRDVDVAVGGTNGETKPDNLVSRLGLTALPFITVKNGCATGGVALLTARNMLMDGNDIACVVGYDNHSRGAFNASPARYGIGDWYGQTGMMLTTSYFGLKARRYLHDHAISDRTLGMVSKKAFDYGEAHPKAWRRKPVSVDEAMDAEVINDPLTRFMFCAPNAGGVALVLARGQRAFDMCDKPVKLAAVELRGRRPGSFEVFSPWLSPGERTSPSIDAAAAAFAAAHVTPADVQVAQVQDTDSGAEIIHLGETGLCTDQAAAFARGDFDIDGRLPINTDGGCLANGEPVGASGLRQVYEVATQLQGRAEGKQVPGAPRVGFTHVYGAPGISACTVLTTTA